MKYKLELREDRIAIIGEEGFIGNYELPKARVDGNIAKTLRDLHLDAAQYVDNLTMSGSIPLEDKGGVVIGLEAAIDQLIGKRLHDALFGDEDDL